MHMLPVGCLANKKTTNKLFEQNKKIFYFYKLQERKKKHFNLDDHMIEKSF